MNDIYENYERETLYAKTFVFGKLVYPKFFKKRDDLTGLWNRVYWYDSIKRDGVRQDRIVAFWVRWYTNENNKEQVLSLNAGDTVQIDGGLTMYNICSNEPGKPRFWTSYPIIAIKSLNIIKRNKGLPNPENFISIKISPEDLLWKEMEQGE